MDASEQPTGFRPNPEFRGKIAAMKKPGPGEADDWCVAYLLTGLPTTFPPIKHAGGEVWIRIGTRTKIGRWIDGEIRDACLDDLRLACSLEINMPSLFEGGVAELWRHFSGPSPSQRLWRRIRRLAGALFGRRPISAGQLQPVVVYPQVCGRASGCLM